MKFMGSFSSVMTEFARSKDHMDSPKLAPFRTGLEEVPPLFCKQGTALPQGQGRSWKRGKGYSRAVRRPVLKQVLAPARPQQAWAMSELKEMISRAKNLGLQVKRTSWLAMTQAGT